MVENVGAELVDQMRHTLRVGVSSEQEFLQRYSYHLLLDDSHGVLQAKGRG